MRIFKDKKKLVTVWTTQLVHGTEIYVFQKKLGGQFSINNKEIEEGDRIFLKQTTEQEAAQWLKDIRFIEELP